MGYSVKIELTEVRFKKEHVAKIRKMLKKFNKEELLPKFDWCRFDNSLTKIDEIFEEMGFETEFKDGFWHITEFFRDNLGRHEEVFRLISPFLEDCEIKFIGEDGASWKFKVIGGVVKETCPLEDFCDDLS